MKEKQIQKKKLLIVGVVSMMTFTNISHSYATMIYEIDENTNQINEISNQAEWRTNIFSSLLSMIKMGETRGVEKVVTNTGNKKLTRVELKDKVYLSKRLTEKDFMLTVDDKKMMMKLEESKDEEVGDDDLAEFLDNMGNDNPYTTPEWNDRLNGSANSILKEVEARRNREMKVKQEMKEKRITALKDKIQQEKEQRENLIAEQRRERERIRDTWADDVMSPRDITKQNIEDLVIAERASSGQYGNGMLAGKINTLLPNYMGKPYIWGGDDRTTKGKGYDCSGFTLSVLNSMGVKGVPRVSRDQFKKGTPVSIANLQVGDLVFFDTKTNPANGPQNVSHVGIYMGKGLMVHASSGSNRIRTEQVFGKYFSPRYMGARRYV